MYRVTFSPPGEPPYVTLYARASGHYGPGEVAPLGPKFEILRGDLPGGCELPLSGPLDFLPGDFVRIYLPGDPEDDPTYLGEIVSEPWDDEGGSVRARGLTERVLKSAWKGTLVNGVVQPIQKRLKAFLLDVLGRASLPPGVTIGEIADSNATFYALTPFELVGDTITALLPAVPGGSFGVNSRGEITLVESYGAYHRFVLGSADTPPGSTENGANCIRFPYRLPDGNEAWFEGREVNDVAARGEIWDVTTIPASVTNDGTDPTEGMGNVFVTVQRVHPLIPNRTFPQTLNPTFWDVDWEGRLSDGANLGPVATGRSVTASPKTNSRVVLTEALPTEISQISTLSVGTQLMFDAPGTYEVIVTLSTNIGTFPSVVTYTTPPPPIPGGTAPKFASAALSWNLSPGTTGNFTLSFEYVSAQAKGFTLTSAGGPNWRKTITNNGGTIADTPFTGSMTFTLAGAGVSFEHTLSDPWAITNGTNTPHDERFPPTLLTLRPDALIQLLWFVSGRANDTLSIFRWSSPSETPPPIASLAVVLENGEEVALVPLDDDPDTGEQRWKFGRDVRFDRIKINGVASAGYGRMRVQDDASLTQYALALLRHRLTPQREWRGEYRTLRRVSALGSAIFETRRGDVTLDVQRVAYDLSDGSEAPVVVSAGTPFASDDAEAVVGAIESVRREVRSAS